MNADDLRAVAAEIRERPSHTWNPAMALAVADWLDACAKYMADFPDYTHDGEDYAAAVVKAWRGES